MDMKEWTTEFKVVNGREPSAEEFFAAKNQGFPSPMQQAQVQVQVAQPQAQVVAGQASTVAPANKLTPASIALRAGLVLVVAAFGYVVGYLFA